MRLCSAVSLPYMLDVAMKMISFAMKTSDWCYLSAQAHSALRGDYSITKLHETEFDTI